MPPFPTLEDQISALTSRVDALESRLARLEGLGARRGGPIRATAEAPELATRESPAPAERGWQAAHGCARPLVHHPRRRVPAARADRRGHLAARRGRGDGPGSTAWCGWRPRSWRARRLDGIRALFDGATALIIGFPLIVEATFRFGLLRRRVRPSMLTLVDRGIARGVRDVAAADARPGWPPSAACSPASP